MFDEQVYKIHLNTGWRSGI